MKDGRRSTLTLSGVEPAVAVAALKLRLRPMFADGRSARGLNVGRARW